MKSEKEIKRLLKNRRRKMRGYQPGFRVMGVPGQFGVVTGWSEETGSVMVWWDTGREAECSPHGLTIVKRDRR